MKASAAHTNGNDRGRKKENGGAELKVSERVKIENLNRARKNDRKKLAHISAHVSFAALIVSNNKFQKCGSEMVFCIVAYSLFWLQSARHLRTRNHTRPLLLREEKLYGET